MDPVAPLVKMISLVEAAFRNVADRLPGGFITMRSSVRSGNGYPGEWNCYGSPEAPGWYRSPPVVFEWWLRYRDRPEAYCTPVWLQYWKITPDLVLYREPMVISD